MIKGIQAFEACWVSLRASHPTGLAQNLLIAQAMGKVTDCYGTVEEIEQTLPADLQVLFRTLIHAYFHGYAVQNTPTANSNIAALPDRTPGGKLTQKSLVGSETAGVEASGRSLLTNQTAWNRHPRTKDFCLINPNEAETLIIEFSSLNYEIE